MARAPEENELRRRGGLALRVLPLPDSRAGAAAIYFFFSDVGGVSNPASPSPAPRQEEGSLATYAARVRNAAPCHRDRERNEVGVAEADARNRDRHPVTEVREARRDFFVRLERRLEAFDRVANRLEGRLREDPELIA